MPETISNTDPNACYDCGDGFPTPEPAGGGAGYATIRNTPAGNIKVCYRCADQRQIAELRTAQRYGAYISGDGKRITTWTGGKLGDITWSRPAQLTRPSFTHDQSSYRSIRVLDVHGNVWTGRGSPGIFIKLRRVKT
jgi:hypothetical protein